MNGHSARIGSCVSGICLALLFVPSMVGAQIYKWVDANGKTHYSERKEAPGNVKTEEVKVQPQRATTQTGKTPDRGWEEQNRQFKQRQIQKEMAEKRYGSPVAQKPKSLSGGREDGTDQSRCNLARDILNGSVKLRNGKPTGQYEREVAQNDVKQYCR